MPSTRTITADMDRKIGQAVRAARLAKGISQSELGKTIGVTFQQIQKGESGANRISASALVLICRRLEIDPADILGQIQ